MATLFIADLHLQTEEPAITAGFLRFLQGEARKADALYILGDLFEAWIGDDDPNPLHRQIASALKALADSGVPCYFLHGNRDFLVGQRFARESAMTLLPEEKLLDLFVRKCTIPGSNACFWPYRCLSAAVSLPECAPTAKRPTAASRWKLWM